MAKNAHERLADQLRGQADSKQMVMSVQVLRHLVAEHERLQRRLERDEQAAEE